MATTTAASTPTVTPSPDAAAPLPTDAITYEDLYARWERGNWSATELDFTEDARQWRENFTDFEREAALFNYALFFWGEDSVADNLSPYIDAAPLEEQKYFLATQQVDEARHAVFFKRFMSEVCGIGDGTMGGGLEAIKPRLTPGFRAIFSRLDRMADELRANRSRPKLAAAVTLYHLIVEASLAQPGQHMITTYLTERDVLPAFRAGMENIAADEQRHIGFGVKLLADLQREDPHCRHAVADLLREVLPYTSQVLMPPNWDESYLTCFGFSFDRIGIEGVVSLQTKLRSAGLGLNTLPGPPPMPIDLEPVEISRRGLELARRGIIGVRIEPAHRDSETLELLFDTIRRSVNPEHGLRRPTTIQWEFSDADVTPWHVTVSNGSSSAAPGLSPSPDLRLRSSYQDWVDIMGRRLDPRRAMLTRRLRVRGNPLVLAKLPRIFPS
jgi:hypothetical protein